MTQLAFAFAGRSSLARADFLPADSNALALAWLDRADAWPSGRLVLSGPPGSGRSHLAAIFAEAAAAPVLRGAALSVARVPQVLPGHGSAAIDDADAADERALLHLLNLAAERGGRVLLTAGLPAAAWGTALPDLRSRLAASGAASLGIPEDSLARAVLLKLAADRQLRLSPALLDWLATRLPRDLSVAARAIAALDAAALAAGRAPDLRLARALIPGGDEIPMTEGTPPSRPAAPLL